MCNYHSKRWGMQHVDVLSVGKTICQISALELAASLQPERTLISPDTVMCTLRMRNSGMGHIMLEGASVMSRGAANLVVVHVLRGQHIHPHQQRVCPQGDPSTYFHQFVLILPTPACVGATKAVKPASSWVVAREGARSVVILTFPLCAVDTGAPCGILKRAQYCPWGLRAVASS